MSILFVSGVNDRSVIGVDLDEQGRMAQLIDGNASVYGALPLKPGLASDYLLFGKGVRQYAAQFRQKPRLIFNQISDADTHRGSLERCIEFCRQVRTQVINDPRYVLNTGREKVSEALQGIDNVIMPRCWRFQPRSPEAVFEAAREKGLDHPFIVRVAGDHHGRGMVRCDVPDDPTELHALPFDGRDFYLMEYHEYRSPDDGFYHKQRVVVIDGEPLLRHALYIDHWAVHSEGRPFMMQHETWDDDVRRFAWFTEEVLPALRPAFAEITRRLRLEYFGIDCHINADGQVLIFEANANMNVLHSPNQASRYRVEAIHAALQGMLARYSGMPVI